MDKMVAQVDPGRVKGIAVIEAWRPEHIATKFRLEGVFVSQGHTPVAAARMATDALARAGIRPLMRKMSVNSLTRDNGAHVIGQLISGNGGTAFNNANSRIAVGTSTTANASPNTANVLTTEVAVAMDATYPSVGATGAGTSGVVTWRSTFDVNTANQAWNEWGIRNAAAGLGDMLNRAVQAFGTKVSGVVWQITATITFS